MVSSTWGYTFSLSNFCSSVALSLNGNLLVPANNSFKQIPQIKGMTELAFGKIAMSIFPVWFPRSLEIT